MPGSLLKECPGCHPKISVAFKKCPQCGVQQPHKKKLVDARIKFAKEKEVWKSKKEKWNNYQKEEEKSYKVVSTS
jgi:hypothetical protein